MKLRKTLALLLCFCMIIAVFAGCSQTEKAPSVSAASETTESPTPTPEASVSPTALNAAGAYASLEPKTVMLTINGKDVTWDEYFYYLHSVINDMKTQGYDIADWSEVYGDDMTYEDYILDNTNYFLQQNMALNYGAELLNVTLTDADNAAVQADWDSRVSTSESEEAFVAQLEAGFCSKELFMDLMGMSYLLLDCFDAMYGSDGSKLTDEEVADYTSEDGYMMVKHILFKTADYDETGVLKPLPDADIEKAHRKAEEVLLELKNYKGNDFDTYFDELMNQDSEDIGGLSSFPDGYLFQSGDMYPKFEDAAKALQIGEFSDDLVETEVGYHIIYRFPLNYDTIPIRTSNSSTDTLRLITAKNIFYSVFDTWMNSLNVVYSDAYNALDFNKMFAAG